MPTVACNPSTDCFLQLQHGLHVIHHLVYHSQESSNTLTRQSPLAPSPEHTDHLPQPHHPPPPCAPAPLCISDTPFTPNIAATGVLSGKASLLRILVLMAAPMGAGIWSVSQQISHGLDQLLCNELEDGALQNICLCISLQYHAPV